MAAGIGTLGLRRFVHGSRTGTLGLRKTVHGSAASAVLSRKFVHGSAASTVLSRKPGRGRAASVVLSGSSVMGRDWRTLRDGLKQLGFKPKAYRVEHLQNGRKLWVSTGERAVDVAARKAGLARDLAHAAIAGDESECLHDLGRVARGKGAV